MRFFFRDHPSLALGLSAAIVAPAPGSHLHLGRHRLLALSLVTPRSESLGAVSTGGLFCAHLARTRRRHR
jgi:hypothetical protein